MYKKQYQISAVLWKLRIKGNQKYHTENKPGKNSNPTNKNTDNLIPLIERMLKRPDFLKTSTEEYPENKKQRRKPSTKKKKKERLLTRLLAWAS